MLYCMQVETGKEEATIAECGRKIPDSILTDIYTPRRIERVKLRGTRTDRERILFPGYVFVQTDDIDALYHELRKTEAFTRLISAENRPIPVSDEEIHMIDRLSGKSGLMQMSTGYIVGDEIRILEGPLYGLEGMIVRIDRHKRRAWIETDMFGRRIRIEFGLEIVSKC